MSLETSFAIVLRATEFSETSCIVTLFTENFGKISALAKGARRKKSPFEGGLDLLSVFRIAFIKKSGESLDLLTEAKLEKCFRVRKTGLSALYCGYYIAELLTKFTHDGDPFPGLYRSAQRTLASLHEHPDLSTAMLRWELEVLQEVGHAPFLEGCVECGEVLPEARWFHFAIGFGGLVCPKCRVGKRGVVQIGSKSRAIVLSLLEAIEQSEHEESRDVLSSDQLIPPECRGELRGLMNQYLIHQIGTPFRMHPFLEFLRR